MRCCDSFFRCAAVSLLLFMSACATLPKSMPVSVKNTPKQAAIIPDARASERPFRSATPSASTAWKPLLAKADEATNLGDYERAMALLERAQRIDPDSADVYLGMARTHNAKGDDARAKATAERGLLYCSGKTQCDALRAYIR